MFIKKIQQVFSGQFIRNVGWLGGAELVNRIFRLATTVTLARTFSTYDYGLMAVIYTVFDIAYVFTLRGGIGAKIIQADEKDVKTICNTAYWLNWILCGSLFIIQCIAAFFIAHFSSNQQLFLPLCTSALMYLMMPLFTINGALIERENQLKVTAIANAAQSILSNLMIVSLAFIGMGVWAIVWAMVFTTPVWIVITWINNSWRPPISFSLVGWQEIVNFGKNLLLVELLNKLRMNIDYLLISYFLGIDALGVYYFAFNAGLGITMNVINTFMSALFPYICAVRSEYSLFKYRYLETVKKIAIIVIPIVSVQSFLAPFYVPIIFGQKWVIGIPILVLICLSAVPLTLSRITSQLLQAVDKSHIDLYWNVIFTVIFAVSLLLAVRGGILWVAVSVLITQAITIPLYTVWVFRYVFAKNSDIITTVD